MPFASTPSSPSSPSTPPTDADGTANRIVEGAAGGTETGLVAHATDVDSGQVLHYRLTDDAGGRFAIDAATGAVSVAAGATIDFETGFSYSVTVVANDGQVDSLPATFVIEVANAAPGIVVDAEGNAANNTIAENSAAGTAVANLVLAATDPAGGALTFALDDPSGKFAIDQATRRIVLRTGASLDFETDSRSYTIGITARDVSGLAGPTASFTIMLTNVIEAQIWNGTANADVWTVVSDDNWTVNGLAGNDSLTGAAGNEIFNGGQGNDTLAGGAGNDSFLYAGNASANGTDAIDGGAGTDTIRATAANTVMTFLSVINVESISAGGFAGVTLLGSSGADLFDLTATTITGIARIDAGSGDDIVRGTVQADVIRGSGGNDTLSGGAGDDVFEYTGTGGGSDVVDGGDGLDTLRALAANTTIGLASVTGIEAIDAGGFAGVTVLGTSTSNIFDFSNTTLTGIVRIDGSGGNDAITGSTAADTLRGNAGNDVLAGGGGNDVFEYTGTGGGYDAVDGGSGQDSIVALAANTVIGLTSVANVENVGSGGFAGVIVSGSAGDDSLDFSGATLSGIGRIDGAGGADTIAGSADADTIRGGAGDDVLSGNGGDDVFDYTGNLTASGNDRVDGGAGSDMIAALADNTVIGLRIIAGIEAITSRGFANVTIAGSASADLLEFSNAALSGIVRIDAGLGDDTVTGSAGNDRIRGGAGDDALAGGLGDDVFEFSGTGQGFDMIDGGAGTDTVIAMAANTIIGIRAMTGVEAISGGGFSGVTLATGANDDAIDSRVFTISGIASYDLGLGNDILVATATAETIVGGAGDDSLSGGDGNDVFTYSGSDTGFDVVDGGAGTDSLRALVNDTVIGLESIAGVETITANGKTNVVVLGSAADNIFDFSAMTLTGLARIDGGAGNDTITGNAAVNIIWGGSGNDRLRGNSGNDTLDGGIGQDVAVFAGLIGTYTIATVNGTLTVKDNSTSQDGNDGTDTLVGIEKAEFKGGVQVGISSPIVLDLDGNGVTLVNQGRSNARIDLDGDGLADQTSWIGSTEGFLFLDRDGNGTLTDAGEFTFTDDVQGARSDLEGLRSFDSNRDGILSSTDARFADFKVWQDRDGDGSVDAGDILTLTAAGLRSLDLKGTAVSAEVKVGEVAVLNRGSYTRTDGTTREFLDVALTYASFLRDGLPEVARTVHRYDFKSSKARLVTINGEVQVASKRLGGIDTRAGFGGAMELNFSNYSIALLQPLVLDLDGDGVNLLHYRRSNAMFDMNGDGAADDTGWIDADDAFLVIDRDLDGQITDPSELTLLAEDPKARNSLSALRIFDTNNDGQVDEDDTRFAELKLWIDRNSNGTTDEGELVSLEDAGIASLSLASQGRSASVKLGDNLLAATATFTRANGSMGTMGSVALSYAAAPAPLAADEANSLTLSAVETSAAQLTAAMVSFGVGSMGEWNRDRMLPEHQSWLTASTQSLAA